MQRRSGRLCGPDPAGHPLLDLPPELLERILAPLAGPLARDADLARLGMTCRRLRGAAWHEMSGRRDARAGLRRLGVWAPPDRPADALEAACLLQEGRWPAGRLRVRRAACWPTPGRPADGPCVIALGADRCVWRATAPGQLCWTGLPTFAAAPAAPTQTLPRILSRGLRVAVQRAMALPGVPGEAQIGMSLHELDGAQRSEVWFPVHWSGEAGHMTADGQLLWAGAGADAGWLMGVAATSPPESIRLLPLPPSPSPRLAVSSQQVRCVFAQEEAAATLALWSAPCARLRDGRWQTDILPLPDEGAPTSPERVWADDDVLLAACWPAGPAGPAGDHHRLYAWSVDSLTMLWSRHLMGGAWELRLSGRLLVAARTPGAPVLCDKLTGDILYTLPPAGLLTAVHIAWDAVLFAEWVPGTSAAIASQASAGADGGDAEGPGQAVVCRLDVAPPPTAPRGAPVGPPKR